MKKEIGQRKNSPLYNSVCVEQRKPNNASGSTETALKQQQSRSNDVAGGIQESEEYYDESQGQSVDGGALDMEDIKVAQNDSDDENEKSPFKKTAL